MNFKLQTKKESRYASENFLVFLLGFIACFSPLPFGSNDPLYYSAIAILAAIGILIWSVNCIFNSRAFSSHKKYFLPIALPFCLCLIWAFLQTRLQIPGSPSYRLFSETGTILQLPNNGAISLNRGKSFNNLLLLCAYGTLFFLSQQIGISKSKSKKILTAISVAAGIYAIYGIAVFISGNSVVLWEKKTSYLYSLTATFINRNSYATYAGICFIVTLGLFIKRIFSNLEGDDKKEILRQLLVNFTRRGFRHLTLLAIIGTSILLSDSRAGTFSLLGGIIAFLIALSLAKPMREFRNIFLTISAIIALLIIGIFALAGDQINHRMYFADQDLTSREEIYNDTIKAIDDYWLTGSGLGTFEEVFMQYRGPEMNNFGNAKIEYAHNTYLTLLLELGLPGFALMMLSFMAIIYFFLRGIRIKTTGYIYPAIGIGITALITIHSFFDFSMEIPAVASVYSIIAGLCIGQSRSFRKRRES